MAKLKKGKLSKLEKAYIQLSHVNGASAENIANELNRSLDLVSEYCQTKQQPPTQPNVDMKKIPDPPTEEVVRGEAKKLFESTSGEKKRSGIAVMTEALSDVGDRFLKHNVNTLAPMSSKHSNCITQAQPTK